MIMKSIVKDTPTYRPSFETFKSNVCHRVHDIGDLDFLAETLESDKISELWKKQWYPESMYLLAMVDYLCRENDLPVCTEYEHIRCTRLNETIYPASVHVLCAAINSDVPRNECLNESIPEFIRFNIVESEVRNVF